LGEEVADTPPGNGLTETVTEVPIVCVIVPSVTLASVKVLFDVIAPVLTVYTPVVEVVGTVTGATPTPFTL
jgi:hypothetical protein